LALGCDIMGVMQTRTHNTIDRDAPQEELPVVVYTRDRFQRLGWRVWRLMFHDLVRSRGLIWRLFVRSWSAQYRQSWMGYVWAIVPPVVAAVAFSFAVRHRVLRVGPTPIPYVCYALWGMTVWQLFTGIYNSSSGVLKGASQMISRINFPKDALVFASIGQPLFTFLIRLVVVFLVFGFKGVMPGWTALLAPFALIPLVLIALGMGMIMAVVSVAGSDIRRAFGAFLNFGMLLTPVIYPPPVSWPSAAVNVVNPLSPVLSVSHSLLQGAPITTPVLYLAAWIFGLLMFGCGWRIFRMALPRIAERF
jgi:lipopolysaccharide transport system permease protein